MNDIKFSLGEKVKCTAYLKKKPITYVCANKEHASRVFSDHAYPVDDDEWINLDEEGWVTQKTKEICAKEFKGVVVARKFVSTENEYMYPTRQYDGYCEDDVDAVQVTKSGCVECVQVFYALGKSRLVPLENIIRESKGV